LPDNASPRILSPNLGCPLILSPDVFSREGFEIVLVCSEQDWRAPSFTILAAPSFGKDGVTDISLDVGEPTEIVEDGLPPRIEDLLETRFLISTTLRTALLAGNARFVRIHVRPRKPIGEPQLRRVEGATRSTLYDLRLLRDGHLLHSARHAISIRPHSRDVHFIHLTDLHVAARNDLMDLEINCTVNASPPGTELPFNNFNNRLRSFIREANRLADSGQLDCVLALGDLVDFVNQGLTDDPSWSNNWHTLADILTGDGWEGSERKNHGLRVPVFTTTGNHDWRGYTYAPGFAASIFGAPEKDLNQFDHLYADTSEVVAARITEVQSKLVAQGSPILQRSWWGTSVGKGLGWLQRLPDRVGTWTMAALKRFWPASLTTPALVAAATVAARYLSPKLRDSVGTFYAGHSAGDIVLLAGLIVVIAIIPLAILATLLRNIGDYFTNWLREKIEGLIAIESGTDGLLDYFLEFNPYFNYAFRLENCYFALMDSGHDALTGESFWDDGGKKIRRLKIRDNILGGSPESMAFYPANECYPYSQLAWLETVLDCVRRQHETAAPGDPRPCRIVVGLHAPPANLSPKQRQRADSEIQQAAELLLPKKSWGGYDIHYGTVNHYVSQFFYICLGYRESFLTQPSGPGVDLVLSGHAHWNIEFRLVRPMNVTDGALWHPQVFYGNFSKLVETDPEPSSRWWSPLLLQTAASGPPSESASANPYYRRIHIDSHQTIRRLRPLHL
jgi:hypothetical protein